KVPLTLDRENVQPSFLRQVRVAVFNRMHATLSPEDVNSEWVESAIASPDCAPEAAQNYVSKRFGEKRASFDPSDPEASGFGRPILPIDSAGDSNEFKAHGEDSTRAALRL